jgi:hypothetical protein
VTREGQGSVEVASRLSAPAQAVWERVSTFEGVNDELMPLMRMTAPRHIRSLSPEDVVLGQPDGDGTCTVRDRLTFEPRGPVPVAVAERVVRAIFRHRHRRLRRRFGP